MTRVVDTGGSVSFAGAAYRVGRSWGGRQVEVAIVASSVQISENGKVLRVHAIRHDRTKEHTAPSPRPKVAPVSPRWPEVSNTYRSQFVKRVPGLDIYRYD